MPRALAPAFVLLAGLAAPAQAAEYLFVGKWDCEVATMTFTNRTYNNGSETLRYTSITFGKGEDVRLHFPKNYVITLSNVTRTSMNWFSSASDDGFTCKRLP